MRRTPPEILIAGLLLLGNDFLVLSRLLLGENPIYIWIWGAVFGLIILWFIIRREPVWKILGLLLAAAITYFGGPVGFMAFHVCPPRQGGRNERRIEKDEDHEPEPAAAVRHGLTPRRLHINAPMEGVRLDHAKNSINLK